MFDLLSLFLHSACPLCDRPAQANVCQYCQQRLKQAQLNDPCQFWRGELPLFVWGTYEGQIKRAIAALKYDHQRSLARVFGDWLAKAWLDGAVSAPKRLIVVPIPLHRKKLHSRGFNQAELIAHSFCQRTGYSLAPQGLKRQRETEAMFNLTSAQRAENLQNAFSVDKSLTKGRLRHSVLILDDIYTTGTTVKEAAQTLRSGGINVFGVAAIATPPTLIKD